MKTLITGATGFEGSSVLRRLLQAGHEVRALVRAGSDRRNVEGLPVELAIGDLNDPPSLRAALSGCENLFHVAADYRLWVPHPDAIYRTNVDGSRSLIRGAMEAGVRRIVYTSSVATLGINRDQTPSDEDTPVSLSDMTGHYKRSKFLAEQAVSELVQNEQAPVVIVNPSTPIGARDVKPTPTGRIVLDMLRRRMPAYVDTGLNFVNVEDVAAGHLLAFEKGVIGQRYVLGGENMSLRAFLELIAGVAGMKAPRIRIPITPLVPAAWIAERIAGATGREPFATVDSLRMARKHMFYSSEKAKRALGYAPGPVRDGVAGAVAWFRNNGYC
jgi:dihydroflavonol-4-reductase